MDHVYLLRCGVQVCFHDIAEKRSNHRVLATRRRFRPRVTSHGDMAGTEELSAGQGLSQAWFGPDGEPGDPAAAKPGAPGAMLDPSAAHSQVPRASSGLLPLPDPASLPPLPPLPEGSREARSDGDDASSFAPKNPEETERWQAIIAAYEREAKALGNKPRAGTIYLEVGRIWEEQLGKQRNAAMCYQRAFHLNPRSLSVLHASRRLFTEVGNWGMVVQILQAEIEATTDSERKAALLAEKGSILEEKLRNPDEAIKAFREALDVWPAEPLALNSIEQLYLARRDYQALYSAYLRALEVIDTPDRRMPLLVAAAQLAEDRLEDVAGAITLYLKILEIDPVNRLALAALRRLYVHAENWEELVSILARSAEVAEDMERATAFLMAAARLQHERMGATDRALLSLLKALEYSPRDLVLLREIEWLYETNEKHEEVVKVLRAEIDAVTEPRERVPVLFRLGSVLEDRLGRADEAIPVFEEAVRLLPNYKPAMQALGRLYERTGRAKELADLYEMELRTADEDPSARGAKLYKLAEIYESRLDREDDAITLLQELLSIQPTYVPAMKALERLFRKRSRWPELIALYEREVLLTEDVDQRIFLLARIGQINEEKLEALEQAAAAYERILELKPHHLEAIRTLARINERRGRWVDVLRAFELEVEATSDQNEVVAILHRAGLVQEENLRDVPAAIASYEKVLSLSPSYLPALRSLGKLYHREGRWEDLIAMYRREIEVSRSPEQAVGLLFRIAEIVGDKMKDDQRAAGIYEEILSRMPENLPALKALAHIHARRNEHDKLAQALLHEVETAKEPEAKVKALQTVAEIYEHKLQRADRAAEIYQDILRIGQTQSAVEALVRIYSATRQWSALSNALRSALDVAPDAQTKAAILVRLAEITGDKLGKPTQSADHLESALALLPDDVTIMSQLERVYTARRDWERAISISERLADHEIDPRQYAARQIRIGAMKESELDPPKSGAAHYLKALERVPGHPIALRGLEIGYRKAGAWEGLAALYHREALLTRDSDRRANLFFRAGDLFEHRLGKDEAAEPMYASALEVAPGFLPAVRGMRRISERKNDAKTALEYIRVEADVVADHERAIQLLFESGEIYQDRLNDLVRAIESFTQIITRAPKHTKAFNRLEQIYTLQRAWTQLLDLLVNRAKALDSADEQADVYLQAAKVAHENLNDRDRAIELYTEVLERKPMHAKALQRVGPLLEEAQVWDKALDVFHKLVSVTQESAIRSMGFRALGKIYQEHREDLVKAVQAFQAAVQADPTDTESLTRLAQVYRTAQDWSSSVNVLLRLAEVQRETQQRVDTLLELGKIYLEGFEDVENAILANKKALELDPSNTQAILGLADLYERSANWKALTGVTEMYTRGLPGNERKKAVPIFLKMAEIYEGKLQDDAKASAELRLALEADSGNAAALQALARIYAKSASSFPQAVDIHRRLLRIDPFRVESYHDMRRMFERRGELDKAFVICEILTFLRSQQQDEDLFFHEHKLKVAPHAAGTLSPEDHDRLVTHPDERGIIRVIFELLTGELSKVVPPDLSPYELVAKDKHTSRSDLPMRKLADELAKVLGVPPFDLWITKKHDLGMFLENDDPPALIVGAGVARRIQERELRFMISKQLERLKAGHHLIQRLSPQETELMVLCAAKIGRPDLRLERDPMEVENLSKKLLKFLSRKAKGALQELGQRMQAPRLDVERHRAATFHTANRAGLVLTNDIEVVIRSVARDAGTKAAFADANGARDTIGQNAEIRELLAYAVSEEYFAARTKLGFSIQS
jgi:cellulose synthase operon protein C